MGQTVMKSTKLVLTQHDLRDQGPLTGLDGMRVLIELVSVYFRNLFVTTGGDDVM